LTDTALLAWGDTMAARATAAGTRARFRSLLDGREWARDFDSLVLATAPSADDGLRLALQDEPGLEVHAIGDCFAPRRASTAIYEGRRLALAL
jgi:hypothetical protein